MTKFHILFNMHPEIYTVTLRPKRLDHILSYQEILKFLQINTPILEQITF